MYVVSLLLTLCAAGGARELENAMPARLLDSWTVEVGPGTVHTPSGNVTLAEPVRIEVPRPDKVEVRDERYDALPVFNDKAGGWVKGAQLKALVAEECTASGALYPESVRVKPVTAGEADYAAGADYAIDTFWGTFGRIEGGRIGEATPVLVDYDYEYPRLDSVVAHGEGRVELVRGTPAPALALPPALPEGAVAVVNVWLPGRTEALTEENLYSISFDALDGATKIESTAERLLPKTLAKLRNGDPVTIVAWGDSVTNGGGVGNRTAEWYQNQFVERLRQRFPKSEITLHTAAWPGGNSTGYMTAAAGGTYDYHRDVLDRKPDLVTIEFVNDAYFDVAGVAEHYGRILTDLRGIGAEAILITPHFVRPDWMKVETLKLDEDPRPYVKGLYAFAKANEVAVADASAKWCRLWRQGLPYITLEANAINHPDVRGHKMFADALMEVFPGQ